MSKIIKFRGVLDGFRSTPQPKPEGEQRTIVETLRPENFRIEKTFLYGFPYSPTALAYDSVQRLLAIGTKTGTLRILGQPGVDAEIRHGEDVATLFVEFLQNEGAVITVTSDDSLHLWNIKHKNPEKVHSLKFQKERITRTHLPLKCKWLYVGTERGNVHVVNIDSFDLSGYVIHWNKAIDVLRPSHPGPVVHLSDCPTDSNKLLIGFECGQIVLWNLKTKKAELRWQASESMRSIAWHHEGKQFVCAHVDGSLTFWNARAQEKPFNTLIPHAQSIKEGKADPPCKAIQKVEWKSAKSGESYVIFSGGTAYDEAGSIPCVTVVCGKQTTILEMEHNIVDFVTLCDSPYTSEPQDPFAIAVLLQNDLVIIDLTSSGYPCFINPYPMNIHESAVSCCCYFADCPSDIIPALYSVGCRGNQKRHGFSEKDWPVSGGEWSPTSCSYNEIIVTGHVDGCLKFWDASAGGLQILYKLKTAKYFEKPECPPDSDPFAIQHISLCPESRELAVAGNSSHVIVFKFRKQETNAIISVLEIPNCGLAFDSEVSPDPEHTTSRPSITKSEICEKLNLEPSSPLEVKQGNHRKAAGFQAHLICISLFTSKETPFQITSLTFNSSYGLLAYGSENGIILVDVAQKCCLMNVTCSEMYGTSDPFQRVPRSPKRTTTSGEVSDSERCQSPNIDQCLDQLGLLDFLDSPDPPSEEGPSEEGSEISCTHTDEQEEEEGRTCSPQLVDSLAQANTTLTTSNAQSQNDQANNNNNNIGIKPLVKKSSKTWKGFSLKKFAGDYKKKSPSQSLLKGERERSQSAFFDREVSNYAHSEGSTSDRTSTPDITEENLDELDRVAQPRKKDSIPLIQEPLEHSDYSDEDGTERSADLRLDIEGGVDPPIRPIRKKELEKQPIRDGGRLLSVPNIKYNPSKELLKTKSGGQSLRNLIKRLNKLDSSVTSRSRSSSMSSLENVGCETVQCLLLTESWAKKSDNVTACSLWIGTSVGSLFSLMVSLPATDMRQSHDISLSPINSLFRLKGQILNIAFLDQNGNLVRNTYKTWKSDIREKKPSSSTSSAENSADGSGTPPQPSAMPPTQATPSPTERHFAVVVSEKQARVFVASTCEILYKHQLTESDLVVKAEVVLLKESVCLLCYISNGHICAYSLPSLKPILDVPFLPLSDLRIAKTFCFGQRGHGLFFSSPSEIQMFTVSADYYNDVAEMVGELYLTRDMPEPPKQSIFKSLLGGTNKSLDREELFGDASGKPVRNVATLIPGSSAGIDQLNQRAISSTSEVGRAHQMMVERGQKLGQLEDRTEKMMNEADKFASGAHELLQRQKDKKWYQL